jgi:hypothetical protein
VWDAVVRNQEGIVSRAQALAAGFTRVNVRHYLATGRWQRIFPGVYATFSGPLPRRGLLWAVVLRAGPEAVLSHETAAELLGMADRPAPLLHVTIPAGRTVTAIPGVRIHRCRRTDLGRHPSRLPPQTRVEETAIDLTQSARSVDEAMSWLATAVGARLTTPQHLAATMRLRPRLRWRALLDTAIADIGQGCHSLLELRYLRTVERAHRLPVGQRQAPSPVRGTTAYDDVRYPAYRTRVELDGRAAHPDQRRWRDMRRDNAATTAGDRVLRYGMADVDMAPCQVATQVGAVLRVGGWTGNPTRCARPDCGVMTRWGPCAG